MKRIILALLLACSAYGQRHVDLTWAASASPGAVYSVYRSTGTCPGAAAAFGKVNRVPITRLTYADTGVSAGSYCYYITATVNGRESGPSKKTQADVPRVRPKH